MQIGETSLDGLVVLAAVWATTLILAVLWGGR